MRILFFCGSLQSGKDGVGDYVRSLAETCILQGNECQMIALNDHHISECVSSVDFVGGTKLGSLRLPAALPWPERMNLAAAFRDQFQPDWLSFQFVAYGYHDHGIVWKLSQHFQVLLAGCPLHIMFHEIWVGMPPDAPLKHRLIADLGIAFHRGKDLFERTPTLTAGELYDHVSSLATAAGWEFGAATAGHLIGHFPHERAPGNPRRFSIRHGNPVQLRERDADGRPRHWILEIHFVDRARQIGGFLEQLLTV